VLPKAIRFRKGTGGKPAITGDNPGIRFNLSHSKGYALLAIAYDREVGVDVEVVRPKPKAAALVERFFSPNEKAAFRKLAPHEEDAAFFAGWTRKEAYVKAVGKGLRFPLDRFDVSLGFETVLPADFFPFFVSPAVIGYADLVNAASFPGDFSGQFRFDAEAVLFEGNILNDVGSESFVTGFHIRQVQVREHVGKKCEHAVAHVMPEYSHHDKRFWPLLFPAFPGLVPLCHHWKHHPPG